MTFKDIKDGSVEAGQRTEDRFAQLLTAKGLGFRHANRWEDRNHIDFFLDDKRTIEVKSAKKISRQDFAPQFKLIWVELLDVNGNLGWLYGSATHVAFEQERGFIVIKLTELQELVKRLCKLVKVADPYDALYKVYQRQDRSDRMTMIAEEDLRGLPSYEFWAA